MQVLAMLDSGNYAFYLQEILDEREIKTDVVAIPCKLAKYGCSYCLKFEEEYINSIINIANEYKLYIRELYGITESSNNIKYEKLPL